MKKIIQVFLSLTFLSYTFSVNADTVCYDITGEVKTINTSLSTQSGFFEFTATDPVTGEVLQLEGNVMGQITYADLGTGTFLLNHTYTIEEGLGELGVEEDVSFSTLNDTVTLLASSPVGCFYPAHESVTNIHPTEENTANVESISLDAYGDLNSNAAGCLGLPSKFEEISGEMCFNH